MLSVSVGTEPMSLGSPTSPKPTSGAQFLPGFLLGDLPAPASPQPRSFSLSTPISESKSAHRGELGDASAASFGITVRSFVLKLCLQEDQAVSVHPCSLLSQHLKTRVELLLFAVSMTTW